MQQIHLCPEQLVTRTALLSKVLRPMAHQVANDVTYLASTLELALAYEVPQNLAPSLRQASAYAQDMCDELRRAARAVMAIDPAEATWALVTDVMEEALEEVPESTRDAVRLHAASGAKVFASTSLVAQAVAAVVSNAREAGATEVNVTFQGTAAGHSWTVADNGQGFKAGMLADALLPFVTTKPLPHRGIGLALVQGVVASHCGSITVESEPGRTAVTLALMHPATAAPELQLQGINS